MNAPTFDEATLPRDVARLFGALPQRTARRAVATSWGAASVRGVARARNEDAWSQRAGRWFAVADGMGGRPAGAEAAETAVSTALDALERATAHDWQAMVTLVNDAVRASAWSTGVDRNGAALAVVELHDARATILHLGDVRIYRLRRNAVEQLTTDHSIGEELARAGLDPARAGLRPAELAALTVYLGDADSAVGFSVRTITVDTGDRLVLCTDGAYRPPPPAVWSTVAGAADQPAADALVAAAERAGGGDDATALVVTLGIEPW